MDTHYVLVAPQTVDKKYLIFGETMQRRSVHKTDIDIKLTDDINKVHIYSNYNSAKQDALYSMIAIENNPVVNGGAIGIRAVDSNSGTILTRLNETVESFIGLFHDSKDGLMLTYEEYNEFMPYRGLSMGEMNTILESSNVNTYQGYLHYEEEGNIIVFHGTSRGKYAITYLDEVGNETSITSGSISEHKWKLDTFHKQGIKIVSEGKV